jgi:ectoine hydroxylase-related dioxygenase (phytanoyl-CoA dioxygenase family)
MICRSRRLRTGGDFGFRLTICHYFDIHWESQAKWHDIFLSVIDLHRFAEQITVDGWAVTPPVPSSATTALLRGVVAAYASNKRGGARNLLENVDIQALARSQPIRELAEAVLGDQCFAVRALFFDKTPSANWKVIWHQDLTIATREQSDVPGYGPWTKKAGVPHVQPPVPVLENMVALRVHLDPCGETNGPVRVISGSHRFGRLSAKQIDELRALHAENACVVEEGGILGFRPLIVHASSPAQATLHRRVIHLEFATGELASPLSWRHRIS